ncbi:hypothetical protein [Leptospira sp. GIMC2001]|uniref:hypothetical protein n=1 Tax=Leptospira sp. GIMC2001 TaxID=1513297 RepID=UPI002349B58D|nr:hypothetical protein [Leptospira sp. GIMC2001]WCL48351.1 hypothetical protein O4O04_13680 [Leptospira sp. GIMC2001]
MKKIITYITILVLALSFAFCSSDKPQVKETPQANEPAPAKQPTVKENFKMKEKDFK